MYYYYHTLTSNSNHTNWKPVFIPAPHLSANRLLTDHIQPGAVGEMPGPSIFAVHSPTPHLAAWSAFLSLFILKKFHIIIQVQNLNSCQAACWIIYFNWFISVWVISFMCLPYINNGRQLLIFLKPLGSMNCSISFTISNRKRCKITNVGGCKQLSKRRLMP